MQQAIEDAISARFPDTPLRLMAPIQAISDPQRLQGLISAVLTAPDLQAIVFTCTEHVLTAEGAEGRRGLKKAHPLRSSACSAVSLNKYLQAVESLLA